MILITYKKIPLYGICFFLGIILAVSFSFFLRKRKKIQIFDFLSAVAYILLGALAGAKILFLIVSWREIVRLQLTFVEIMKGGFVFYGGLLGGLLGLFIYSKQFKENFFEYADIFAVSLPLGHSLGRLGCLFAGCCYGTEYSGLGCIIYESSYNIHTPIGVPLLPLQAIEAVLLILLFVILLAFYLKYKKSGLCSIVYLQSYAALRFILEFFRGDIERGILFSISVSQWISIVVFLTVTIFLIKKHLKNRKPKNF